MTRNEPLSDESTDSDADGYICRFGRHQIHGEWVNTESGFAHPDCYRESGEYVDRSWSS